LRGLAAQTGLPAACTEDVALNGIKRFQPSLAKTFIRHYRQHC
jgi:hypothetical protein